MIVEFNVDPPGSRLRAAPADLGACDHVHALFFAANQGAFRVGDCDELMTLVGG
jgi:hypothetical protein